MVKENPVIVLNMSCLLGLDAESGLPEILLESWWCCAETI